MPYKISKGLGYIITQYTITSLIFPYGLLYFTKNKALFIFCKLAIKSSQCLYKQQCYDFLNREPFMARSHHLDLGTPYHEVTWGNKYRIGLFLYLV